jgi:hypothetical protein
LVPRVVIVEPEDTSHDTCWVINTKEEAVVLPDLKYDGTRDRDLSQQEMISQDEKNLASALVMLSLVLMIECLIISFLYELVLLVKLVL